MSKNKNKDKKAEDPTLLAELIQAQKRDLIESQYTIKKLEERLNEMMLDNKKMTEQIDQTNNLDKQKIEILELQTKSDEQRMQNYMRRITQLQLNLARANSLTKTLSDQIQFQKQARQKQVNQLQIRFKSERSVLQMQIENLQIYSENRQKNEQEMVDLRERLQFEKAEKIREVADKQRQKVQATDKLQQQMLKKVKQMKTNLLSLKKQQLSTTTRLTILQNHQLTSELEYQSKQTQRLVGKQDQLQHKIKHLNQQLAIHKDVEDQLAKRSLLSKGVIKKLNDRVNQLQKELQKYRKTGSVQMNQSFNGVNQSRTGTKNKIAYKQNEDNSVLVQIQKQLQRMQKKYSECLSKLLASEKQRQSLAYQVKRSQNSCNELVKLLIKFNSEILQKNNKTPDQTTLQIDPVLSINLFSLRNKDTEEWTNQQMSFVVKVLMNLVKPYLDKKNIMIPALRKLLVVDDYKTGKSETKLPRISKQVNENSLKGLMDLPLNVASKIVGSNLREWGETVKAGLLPKRKMHRLMQSQR